MPLDRPAGDIQRTTPRVPPITSSSTAIVSSSSQWASSMTAVITPPRRASRSQETSPATSVPASDGFGGSRSRQPASSSGGAPTSADTSVAAVTNDDSTRAPEPSTCGQAAYSSTARPPACRSASSASSRVLPEPGSPSIQTIGTGRSRAASSTSRPTIGSRRTGIRATMPASSDGADEAPFEVEQIGARQQAELGERPPASPTARSPRCGGRPPPEPSPAAASALPVRLGGAARRSREMSSPARRTRAPRRPTAPRRWRPARPRPPRPASPTPRRRRRRTGDHGHRRGRDR